MATDLHMDIVEKAIGYHYVDRTNLRLALTSAGAEGIENDGNQVLARMGMLVLRLALEVDAYGTDRYSITHPSDKAESLADFP